MRRSWLLLCPIAMGFLLLLTAEQRARADAVPEKPGSVTVFPVVITPGDNLAVGIGKGIAEVIGMLIERSGVDDVELADAGFSSPEDDRVEEIAAAFGRFVQANPVATDYALLARLAGTPGSTVRQIDTIVVDRQGEVVLLGRDNRKTYRDVSDLEPKDPMTASIFVARKLQKLWGLEDPLRRDAQGGKLCAAWRERSGLPSEDEIAAMKRREAVMGEKLPQGRVAVYPVRIGSKSDAECAARLAGELVDAGICAAVAVDTDSQLEIRGSYNEQKVLWEAARGFREFVRTHPPAADYALFAHYAIASPDTPEAKVMAVHVVVCDRDGRWVLVDYQNGHHADFQQVDPHSADDCSQLVVRRAERWQAEQ